ncbi:uncharacterized protein LOC126988878 [Eriocheir sinensis]|uniref:uncharacterized protein LOC126988878 n=1 Tax=Eriocheir sinensis TaxID=95602 RepID=UPI0021C93BDE|nr:uncharacterized protein LOC126988878 [Eriocheir sinensis]
MFASIENYAATSKASKIEYKTDGEKFAVVLVTEFMGRIHEKCREAGEVVFVDTTSHLDQLNTAVTPFLCAGPAGALPLGVIFTSSQDEESYTAGFQLLRKVLGETAFFQQGHPACFITDNSDAERNALKTVWPESQRFLCIFHILQQVWRWLCDGSHGIKKEDRRVLMTVAKNLVYADSDETFQDEWNCFCQTPEAQKYNQYMRYLAKLIERKEEWSTVYRAGFLLRGHHTNNFAESTMCIIKDIILNRCKAYNTTQLIMFMNEIFDEYMKQRLIDVSLCRRKVVKPPTGISISKESITRYNEDQHQFIVKSQSKEQIQYTVDLKIGLCECSTGMTGKVCKHQAACSEQFLLQLPQILENSPENRHWLASIALGNENVPPLDFFVTLKENSESARNWGASRRPRAYVRRAVTPQNDARQRAAAADPPASPHAVTCLACFTDRQWYSGRRKNRGALRQTVLPTPFRSASGF